MNYTNMIFPELVKLLRKRKLGNAHLYNELNKIYGVEYLPPQQEKARQEAIKLLEEYDKNRFGLIKKIAIISVTIAGFMASVVTIYSAYKR